ncbi:hypothetical protein IC762_03655 [Bradyrhizobium genosp. L]|uniref:hypothetical protein n=1 Tax=Bradyrhizobium genosp. L TaxID=83637 RepID=UPI0018A250C3|nr:hypothetical protein [Bradyrhizobium genosp. L]QPF85439.1 hypothetical protein IC762_03655 [Bradyrhizobium genosp. L]
MSDSSEAMTVKFRCPAELEGKIPPPVRASLGLPGWLKAMPTQAFSTIDMREIDTVKRCPPFVDAMTSGFLLPLICDLKVENGGVTWDNDLPVSGTLEFPRSPVGFHDESQMTGSPLFEPDRYVIKFHNLWTIETPPGYSLFFTHPVNRFDLPFTTLTGVVDCDLFRDSWIHFPARWHDPNFQGVLPKGTPIAQCFPVKREGWAVETAAMTPEETLRAQELTKRIGREPGLYRRQFRT